MARVRLRTFSLLLLGSLSFFAPACSAPPPAAEAETNLFDGAFVLVTRSTPKPGKESDLLAAALEARASTADAEGLLQYHVLVNGRDAESPQVIVHAVWQSREAFEAWSQSEAAQRAMDAAGDVRAMLQDFDGEEFTIIGS